MPSNTPNRGYNRPDTGVDNWGGLLNTNFTDLDTDIQDLFDNKAASPHGNSAHSTNFLENLEVLDSGTSVNSFTSLDFGQSIGVKDNGDGSATIDYEGSGATADIYMGKFILNGTGTTSVTGIPFQPDQVEFVGYANAESYNVDSSGSGSNNQGNYGGSFHGFARNDGGSTVQQAIHSGVSGQSVNNISRYASDSECIGIRYGDQDGNDSGGAYASLTSWNSDGFDLNVSELSQNIVIIYKAFKRP